jgi:hypothetical protein
LRTRTFVGQSPGDSSANSPWRELLDDELACTSLASNKRHSCLKPVAHISPTIIPGNAERDEGPVPTCLALCVSGLNRGKIISE